jgi:hypothetical protein
MAIHIVQLGTPRKHGEGLRIGTVRRPPRGVPKADYARLDFYDVYIAGMLRAKAAPPMTPRTVFILVTSLPLHLVLMCYFFWNTSRATPTAVTAFGQPA